MKHTLNTRLFAVIRCTIGMQQLPSNQLLNCAFEKPGHFARHARPGRSFCKHRWRQNALNLISHLFFNLMPRHLPSRPAASSGANQMPPCILRHTYNALILSQVSASVLATQHNDTCTGTAENRPQAGTELGLITREGESARADQEIWINARGCISMNFLEVPPDLSDMLAPKRSPLAARAAASQIGHKTFV